MEYHGQKQITKQMEGKLQKKQLTSYTVGFVKHPRDVNSPFTDDYDNSRDNRTCEVIKTQKLLIKITTR